MCSVIEVITGRTISAIEFLESVCGVQSGKRISFIGAR